MKTTFLLLLCLAGATLLLAGITPGPKGGRLLESSPLKAEFLVTPDHHAEITFYDDHLNAILPGEQVVALIAEPTSGRVTLPTQKTADGFRSTTPLPAGERYRVVVQLRATPSSRPQNFRIGLNLAPCGECSRPEYACICEGH